MRLTKRLISLVICFLLVAMMIPMEIVSAKSEDISTPKVNSKILGDVNTDSKVNIRDATSIQKYAAAIITLTEVQLEAADVNADSKVNIKDATAIQKWIAGLLVDSNINSPIVSPSESETEPVTEPETDSDAYDYVSFNFLTEGFTNVRITDEKSAIEAVGSVADVLGVIDVEKELKVINVNTVEGDSFYRMQQYYSDIPIYGRAVNICADSDGNGQSLNHNYIQINDVDITASISENEAKQIVINKYGNSVQITNCQLTVYSLFDYTPTLAWQIQIVNPSLIETCFVDAHSGDLITAFSEIFTESELSTYSDSAGTIDFYTLKNADGTYSLIDEKRNLHVYDANNQTVTYAFIDDKGIMYIYDSDKKIWTTTNGHQVEIRLSEDGTNTFDVYYDNNIIGRNAGYFPCVGSPLTSLQVITNPTNVWINRNAALAMSLTEDNYDFYKAIFNRDGFNDKNGTVRISINDDINGDPKNAYSSMGNSDIITVLNFGHAINISSDLVGHEYNHSVEDSLSSLVYYKEAGAIKEALADVFGELFEDWQSDQQLDNDCDWIHGDRNMIDPSSSMQNDKCYYEYNGQSCPVFEKNKVHYIGDEVKEPGLLFPGTCAIDIPYPGYYKGNGYYYGSGDHGGVHTNCTVLSHAAYLMTHPENSEVDALTNEELARVLYRTLHYLPVDCEFDTFAFYVCMSARVLSLSDAKRDCIAEAFERVGIENATFALSEIVKNKFDFTVLSSKETENVHFKLEVIKMPEILIGPGLVNDELPELIMEKTAITGKQSLELEDGTYVLRITDLGDDSISQAINVKIVVDDKNTKAKDNVVVNTDFTDVIVVGIDDETTENDNASVQLSEYYYSNEGFMDIYKPKLLLNPDGTFVFVENLYAGMGTYQGTYQIDDEQLLLTVTSIDFDGFKGDDVELITLTINDQNTLTLNTDLCGSRKGHVFSCGVSADRNSIEQEIISTYGLSSKEQFVSCVGADIKVYPESIYGVLTMTWFDIDGDNREELVVVRVCRGNWIACEVFSEEKGEYSCTASSVICTLSYNISSYIYLYYSDEIGSYCVVTDSSYTGSYTGIDSVTAQVFTLSKNSVCEYANWSVVPSFGISTDFGIEFSKIGVPYAKNCTTYDAISESTYYQPLGEIKHEIYGDSYDYSSRNHKLRIVNLSEKGVVGNGSYAVGSDSGIYYWTYSESNVNPEYTLVFEKDNGDIKEIYNGITRGEIYLLDDTLIINQHLYNSEIYTPQYSAVVLSAEGDFIEEIPDFLVKDIDETKGYYVLYNHYHTDLYDTPYYIYSIDNGSFTPAPWSDEDVRFANANNGIVYYYVNTDDDRGIILYSYNVENECSKELTTSYIEYNGKGPGYGDSPCSIHHMQETENTIYYSCVYTAGSGNYIQRAKLFMYDKVNGKNIELTDDINEIGADFYVFIENGIEKVLCYNDKLNSNVIISDRGNSIEATDKNVQLIGKSYREGGTGVGVPHYLYIDDSGDNIQILPETLVDNADDYVIVYIDNVCYTGEYTFYDIDYHKQNHNSSSWRDTSITDKLETYRYNLKTGKTESICSMKYE